MMMVVVFGVVWWLKRRYDDRQMIVTSIQESGLIDNRAKHNSVRYVQCLYTEQCSINFTWHTFSFKAYTLISVEKVYHRFDCNPLECVYFDFELSKY